MSFIALEGKAQINILKIPLGISIEIIEIMKKKYLLKQPSYQAMPRQQSTLLLNYSTCIDHKARSSQQKESKIDKTRLKTDWPTIQLQCNKPESLGKMKPLKTVKKSQSSGKHLRKGHYLIPTNKQNSKQFDHKNTNRFTFNQFRDHETRDTVSKPQLDTTNNPIRNSETKHLPRQSFQKNKIQKYRFCSPKGNLKMKLADFNNSLQMKPLQVFNRFNKQIKQSLTDLKVQAHPQKLQQSSLQIEELIGAGTFGKVFSARIKSSGQLIALKRVQQDKKYKTRELEIIKMLNNPFIIKVYATFVTDQTKYQYLNIAMEPYHQNFFQLMRLHPLNSLDSKIYVYQMLRGINYMHSLGICHRDLKPQNMLVKGKRLVICDFGSAKVLAPGEQNISYICSRCYRAPQLIFEATNYSTQIDMWSLGCILLQMLNERPLFIADSSLNHILEVIKILGTPSREEVRAMNPSYELSQYDLPKIKGKSFKKMFPQADDLFIDLINKIVCYSPSRRLTAVQALAHPYFDQLRDEKTLKFISHITQYNDLFHFEKGQIGQSYREKLIPRWINKKK